MTVTNNERFNHASIFANGAKSDVYIYPMKHAVKRQTEFYVIQLTDFDKDGKKSERYLRINCAIKTGNHFKNRYVGKFLKIVDGPAKYGYICGKPDGH